VIATLLDDLRASLEGIVTTEARLAATVVLVGIGVVTVAFAAPRGVRLGRRLLVRRPLAHERVPVDATKFDWRLPTALFLRVTQTVVVTGVAVATLVVWGYVTTAEQLLGVVADLVPWLVQIAATVGIAAAAVLGIDLMESWLEEYAAESDAINEHQRGIVFRVLQIAVIAAAGVGALTVWGVNLDGLFVGAGFLGIVIGTAARTTLGSLIAGLVLMFSRPFEFGDWVALDGREGIVADITIVNTRIRNQHGEEIVLPNEKVANATITNRSRLGQLRLSVDVGVDYAADLERAERVVAETLDDLSEVLSNPTPQVVPKSLADSAVVLECRFWIDHPSAAKRTMAEAAVVREVKAALDEAGVKIPYPQRELLGREEAGGLRIDGDRERVDETQATPAADGGDTE
jgi:Small-conductance mechanosensitive channel